jgi:hypothetical protein
MKLYAAGTGAVSIENQQKIALLFVGSKTSTGNH